MSGLPPLPAGRKVTIYSPARTAGQQGVSQTAAGATFRRRPPRRSPARAHPPPPPALTATCAPSPPPRTLIPPLCRRRRGLEDPAREQGQVDQPADWVDLHRRPAGERGAPAVLWVQGGRHRLCGCACGACAAACNEWRQEEEEEGRGLPAEEGRGGAAAPLPRDAAGCRAPPGRPHPAVQRRAGGRMRWRSTTSPHPPAPAATRCAACGRHPAGAHAAAGGEGASTCRPRRQARHVSPQPA